MPYKYNPEWDKGAPLSATEEDDRLVDQIARAMAEADGVRYWKIDHDDNREKHKWNYERMARRHLAAQRVLFNHRGI